MKLSEIIEEWKHDAKIDNVELDRESLHIPNLHAKYLAILSEHRMKLKGLYLKRRNKYTVLTDYYRGNLNTQEDLEKLGREPWSLKLLKQDVHNYVESDNDIMTIDMKIDLEKEIVTVLEEILRAINNRGFQLSTAVKWRSLTNFGEV